MKVSRTTKITLFIILDVILGVYFLSQVQGSVPQPLERLLASLGITLPNQLEYAQKYRELHQPDLDAQALFEEANNLRASANLPALEYSEKLATVAAELLTVLLENQYQAPETLLNKTLEKTMQRTQYRYNLAGYQTLVGPIRVRDVVEVWHTDTTQQEALLASDYTQVGYAVSVTAKDGESTGVLVQVLAQPTTARVSGTRQPANAAATTTPSQTTSASREIPDDEVVAALNTYRATHGLYPLQINSHLCEYAQKRVGDLIAFGSLDGHAGFKKDFEDLNSLPVGIRDYSGGSIGENLAHQHCKNMTTGDSFIATTGTALIEWCFDSSTKGHREAQLSTTFHNVCVRHGKSMYVVIFGE